MTGIGRTFPTAWDAIADTPEEAVVLKARAVLMIALADHIKAQGWMQAEAAKHIRHRFGSSHVNGQFTPTVGHGDLDSRVM